jgi:hypothetical protein
MLDLGRAARDRLFVQHDVDDAAALRHGVSRAG